MPDSAARKFVKDVIAGTSGGIAVVAVGHPFDTLKVRLQTQPTVNPIYSGFLDAARKTIQWEGLSGLYKGVSSPLAGQMVFRMTLFSAFGSSKRWLSTNPDGSTRPLKTSDFYKAGAMTGFAAAFAESPVDFYKSQVQVQIIRSKTNPDYKPAFTKVLDCVRQSFRYNGIKGPFQGLGATLVRNVPANSVYLGSFEVMKREVAKRQDKPVSQLHPAMVVALGGLGGIFYWMVIFPVDAVKSAMQTDDLRKPQRKFPTMASAIKGLYADGGIGRFYKGFTPAIIRAAPANGVMLATVDKVTYWLADK